MHNYEKQSPRVIQLFESYLNSSNKQMHLIFIFLNNQTSDLPLSTLCIDGYESAYTIPRFADDAQTAARFNSTYLITLLRRG